MVDVSQAWLEAHQQTLLPEMHIEITCKVTEPGIHDEAVTSANNEAYFATTDEITNGLTKNGDKYGTLELGNWGLDDSYDYLSDSVDDVGFVSEVVSDGDCKFTTVPTITINFAEMRLIRIPGITITWGKAHNEWATAFRVTVWGGNTQIAQKEVTNNGDVKSVVEMPMEYYDKITIEILSWCLPNHRARCEDIILGLANIFTKSDLMQFTHSQSADLLSAALPKNQITFSLRNDKNQWNPDNPTGVEQYLLERQEVELRYGLKLGKSIEWIDGGVFWLSEWSTPSNGITTSFTARDLLEFMDEEYTGILTGTLFDIAEAAFAQADLPVLGDGSQRYFVHPSLKDYTTTMETGYLLSEVLQMVAHAGNCVMYQNRQGVMRIEPWDETYSGYQIEPKVSFNHPEYTMNKPLRAVSVGYGEDQRVVVAGGNNGNVQTVDNPLLRTEADALRVANRTVEVLSKRKVLSGEYRADVRMDVLDPIIVTSKYASNIIAVTDVEYSTSGGTMRGRYTGRVVSIHLEPELRYAGEFYAGEV